jgi:hypothetical protein
MTYKFYDEPKIIVITCINIFTVLFSVIYTPPYKEVKKLTNNSTINTYWVSGKDTTTVLETTVNRAILLTNRDIPAGECPLTDQIKCDENCKWGYIDDKSYKIHVKNGIDTVIVINY